MKVNYYPFNVKYDKPIKPEGDFKQECINAVNNLIRANTSNLPLAVLMSGGLDSEMVGQSFLWANKPFTAIIGRLGTLISGNFVAVNKHDYQYAVEWCDTNKVHFEFVDIDVFNSSFQISEYALDAKTFSPQYACHMFLMKWCSDNKMFFTSGNGDFDIVLKENKYYIRDDQRECSLLNFTNLYNLKGHPNFWKQDAACLNAYLNLPTVKSFMASKTPRLLDVKHACFNSVVECKHRPKYTGFENLQEWDGITRAELKKTNGIFDSCYHTLINL
jgi:hypothetical protein